MNVSKRFAVLMASAMLMMPLGSCGNKDSSGGATYPELTVDFLDVGKADAIVICTEHSTVIIDCGEKGDGKDVLALLEEKGISSVDYLIITHYDKDHVGGASKVIKNVNVKNVLAPDYEESSEEVEKYEKALADNDIEPQLLTGNISFTLDNAEFTVYAPEKDYYGEDNDNDFSLVTSLRYYDTSFLFTGDAMEQRLDEIMDIGSFDLLKVPYHGRKLDNLDAFLEAVAPDAAVVCTSESEYSSKTQKLLSGRKIPAYATCTNGDITAVSDGKGIRIDTEK